MRRDIGEPLPVDLSASAALVEAVGRVEPERGQEP
jgi:hypothetical protein